MADLLLPTPHLEKLAAAINNDKVPVGDKQRLEQAVDRYRTWIKSLESVHETGEAAILQMVHLLTEYKLYIDVEVIFDSPDDFLYRQKGQLKLDNSIIEEFLPWLLRESIFPEINAADLSFGPTNCYSSIYFDSSLSDHRLGAGIRVRTKNQDFALARKLYIRASHSLDFSDAAQVDTYIAYVVTESKTNLDKTMFQEACATARDLKMAVPAARYFLMCEWLDMTPVSTAQTDVEEVLILRGRRVGSDVRKNYSDNAKRRVLRDSYLAHQLANPFRPAIFSRWAGHIRALLLNENLQEDDVLERGFF
jgi:hypothetical protein